MPLSPREWQKAIAQGNQKKLMRLILDADSEIKGEVEGFAKRAEKIVAGLPGDNIGAIVRRAQYRQRQVELYQMAEKLWGDDVPARIKKGLEGVTSLAMESDKQILKVLLKGLPKSAKALGSSFEAGNLRALEDLRSRILNSISLSDSVYKNKALTTGKIDLIVDEGIALQKSAAEIAKEVKAFINPDVSGGVRYAAQRLGRTELNNTFHATTTRAFAENLYVQAVQWNLSGSHPEGDECDDFADQNDFGLGAGVYPSDQVPEKPHPQCFCYITAITMDEEDFLNLVLSEGGVPVG